MIWRTIIAALASGTTLGRPETAVRRDIVARLLVLEAKLDVIRIFSRNSYMASFGRKCEHGEENTSGKIVISENSGGGAISQPAHRATGRLTASGFAEKLTMPPTRRLWLAGRMKTMRRMLS